MSWFSRVQKFSKSIRSSTLIVANPTAAGKTPGAVAGAEIVFHLASNSREFGGQSFLLVMVECAQHSYFNSVDCPQCFIFTTVILLPGRPAAPASPANISPGAKF